jgi:hypothetical protein
MFLEVVHRLAEIYCEVAAIREILDNFSIQSSKIAQAALTHLAKKVRQHFLSRYCPEHNCIERLRQDLHANLSHNGCQPVAEQTNCVRTYMRRRYCAKCRPLTTLFSHTPSL